jgi:hypothetical protein
MAYCVLKFFSGDFWSLRYRIMSFMNRNILTISLPIWILFISSSCLIGLARNFRTMLNSSGDSGYPFLISYFRGNGFSFILLSMILAISLLYIPFVMLRYISSVPSFLRSFIMKWCWILLNVFFSSSIEMISFFVCLLR